MSSLLLRAQCLGLFKSIFTKEWPETFYHCPSLALAHGYTIPVKAWETKKGQRALLSLLAQTIESACLANSGENMTATATTARLLLKVTFT